MTPKVPTIESGTAILGITVAETVRKNKKMTITTNATVSISSNWTSLTEARIVLVRSVKTCNSTEEGSDALSCGRRFFTRSTTAMILAPGCRWMLTITAGVWFIQEIGRASWRERV